MTKRAIFLAAGAAILSMLVAGSSSAHHALTLAHRPPTAVVAGTDVDLAVEVAGTCALTCSGIEVTLRYYDDEGWLKEQIQSGRRSISAGAFVFTIPGADVGGETLSYWFEAIQEQCNFDADCHEVRGSAPLRGAHSVPVITVFGGYGTGENGNGF